MNEDNFYTVSQTTLIGIAKTFKILHRTVLTSYAFSTEPNLIAAKRIWRYRSQGGERRVYSRMAIFSDPCFNIVSCCREYPVGLEALVPRPCANLNCCLKLPT